MTFCFATADDNMRQKFSRCLCFWRFCISRSHEFAAMIVGAADKDLFPRFDVSRCEIVPVGELVNLVPGQATKEFDCELAEQSISQTVESLEVLKEQD